MRGSVLVALVAVVASAAVAPGADGDRTAGAAELAALETRIGEVRAAMASDLHDIGELQAAAADVLFQRTRLAIAAYRDPTVTAPSDGHQLGEWYVRAMAERDGFDPLAPVGDDQHAWIALRQHEHALEDEYEQLHVAVRHLERLRDRLRRQLQAAAR